MSTHEHGIGKQTDKMARACAFHASRTPIPLKPNTSERSDAFALLMLT